MREDAAINVSYLTTALQIMASYGREPQFSLDTFVAALAAYSLVRLLCCWAPMCCVTSPSLELVL